MPVGSCDRRDASQLLPLCLSTVLGDFVGGIPPLPPPLEAGSSPVQPLLRNDVTVEIRRGASSGKAKETVIDCVDIQRNKKRKNSRDLAEWEGGLATGLSPFLHSLPLILQGKGVVMCVVASGESPSPP